MGWGVDSFFRLLWKGSVMTLFAAQAAGCVSLPPRRRISLRAPNAVGRLSGSSASSRFSASACSGRRTFPTLCRRQSPSRSRFKCRAERGRKRPARPVSRGAAVNAARELATRTPSSSRASGARHGAAAAAVAAWPRVPRAASGLSTRGATGANDVARWKAVRPRPRSGRRARESDRRRVAKMTIAASVAHARTSRSACSRARDALT